MIDANRFAQELAEINRDKPKVALLYSQPAAFWDKQYGPTLRAAYVALVFSGLPVTFISERQLTAGKMSPANSEVKTLIIPSTTHVTQGAIDGLQRFVGCGGTVIRIGAESLSRDEYDRPRKLPGTLRSGPQLGQTEDEHKLAKALRPALP